MLHLLGGASTWSTTPPLPEDRAAFRDARWVIVPEAGHWLHHDQPAIAIDETHAFLARHGLAAGGGAG